MIGSALVATGHGYEKSDRGRCEAFDQFEIIANPLGGFSNPDRERRVFRSASGSGVDYGSHALYLMRRKGERGRAENALFVGVHHGGGRRVWQLPGAYNLEAETLAALLAMPERALYSLLRGAVELAEEATNQAREACEARWRQAAVDKRIKISRQPARGRAFVWIEPERIEGESEETHRIRKAWAKPSGVR